MNETFAASQSKCAKQAPVCVEKCVHSLATDIKHPKHVLSATIQYIESILSGAT
jgi:hypothetical protein